MPLLFSYGSNSLAQLSGRVVSPGEPPLPPPRAATLPGWARVFCGWSTTWSGGVANLHPSAGHSARGSLMLVTDTQLDLLDAYEGAYARTAVLPHDSSGTPTPALAYIHREGVFAGPPSEAYLCAISRMLSEVHDGPADVPLLRPCFPTGAEPFSEDRHVWAHPGVSRLDTLLALCYEAGARCSWTLPRDAVAAADRLQQAGFADAAEVVQLLRRGEQTAMLCDALGGEEAVGALRSACCALEAAPEE
jgi:Gamma-glutamyl cyclotransferase, AIG2-like